MSDAPSIWITGPVARLSAWCAAARAAGWEPIADPLLEIEPHPWTWPKGWERFDWLCVTSGNAVASLVPHLARLSGVRAAIVGDATAAALRTLSLETPVEVAVGPCDSSEELVEAWTPHLRSGERVLWPRSDLAGGLDTWLAGLGVVLAAPIAYTNRLRVEVEPPQCDAVFFASPSAVHAFALSDHHPCTHLAIAIGATTRDALAALVLDEPDRIGKVDVLAEPRPEALRALLGGG